MAMCVWVIIVLPLILHMFENFHLFLNKANHGYTHARVRARTELSERCSSSLEQSDVWLSNPVEFTVPILKVRGGGDRSLPQPYSQRCVFLMSKRPRKRRISTKLNNNFTQVAW